MIRNGQMLIRSSAVQEVIGAVDPSVVGRRDGIPGMPSVDVARIAEDRLTWSCLKR